MFGELWLHALLAAVGPAIEELLGDRIYSRDGAALENLKAEERCLQTRPPARIAATSSSFNGGPMISIPASDATVTSSA